MQSIIERQKLNIVTLVGFVLILALVLLTPSMMLLLIPVVIFGIAVLVYLLSNWKTSVMWAIVATTLNGLSVPVPSAILRPENAIILLTIGGIALAVMVRKSVVVLSAEFFMFATFMIYTILVSYVFQPHIAATTSGIIQLTIAFGGFFIALQLRQLGRETVQRYIRMFVIVFVVQAIYGMLSFAVFVASGVNIGGVMFGQEGNSVTLKGTLLEANLLGSFTGAALLIVLALLLTGNAVRKKMWGVGAVLLFVALVASWTRSAWIGFAIGLLVISAVYLRKIVSPKTLGKLAVISVFLLLPLTFVVASQLDVASGTSGQFASKLTNILETDSGTGEYRINQFDFALADLKGHELLGKGYYSIKAYGEKAWISNLFLFLYHDTGVIGVSIFSLLLVWVLGGSIRFIRRNTGKDQAYMVGMLSGLVLLLFCFNFTPGHVLGIFWIYLGLMVALKNAPIQEMKAQPRGTSIRENIRA